MIQPLPESENNSLWNRMPVWARQHRSIVRITIVVAGLFLFLFFIPTYMLDYFWSGLISHKVLTAMLLAFILLALSLVWSAGQQVDAWFFLIINFRGIHPIWLDWLMLYFTQLGSGIVALGLALVLYWSGNQLLSYQLILGSMTLWLVVELLKLLIHRSRPYIGVYQTRIVGYRAGGQSFPSGHTSQAFFLATLLTRQFQFNPGIGLLFYSAALLVGITRMYVGAHYPRDVLAGAILGLVWGLFGISIGGYVFNGFM